MLQAEPLAALEAFLPPAVEVEERLDLQRAHPAQVVLERLDWQL
jgi:hypothetical protein